VERMVAELLLQVSQMMRMLSRTDLISRKTHPRNRAQLAYDAIVEAGTWR